MWQKIKAGEYATEMLGGEVLIRRNRVDGRWRVRLSDPVLLAVGVRIDEATVPAITAASAKAVIPSQGFALLRLNAGLLGQRTLSDCQTAVEFVRRTFDGRPEPEEREAPLKAEDLEAAPVRSTITFKVPRAPYNTQTLRKEQDGHWHGASCAVDIKGLVAESMWGDMILNVRECRREITIRTDGFSPALSMEGERWSSILITASGGRLYMTRSRKDGRTHTVEVTSNIVCEIDDGADLGLPKDNRTHEERMLEYLRRIDEKLGLMTGTTIRLADGSTRTVQVMGRF